MRCTLDSIFQVGFGVELNCLEGSNKEGRVFMEAFDESHALLCWRYVDPFWKLKRFLNIGSEASLKKNIKVIDKFVNQLIRKKRNLLAQRRDSVSSRYITFSFTIILVLICAWNYLLMCIFSSLIFFPKFLLF